MEYSQRPVNTFGKIFLSALLLVILYAIYISFVGNNVVFGVVAIFYILLNAYWFVFTKSFFIEGKGVKIRTKYLGDKLIPFHEIEEVALMPAYKFRLPMKIVHAGKKEELIFDYRDLETAKKFLEEIKKHMK